MVLPEVMELYTSTWKHIMGPNGGPNGLDLVNFAASIPQLRQTLTCSVCDKLLPIEQALAPPSCNHFVCKDCKGKPRKEKNFCQRCRTWTVYSEDSSLTLLMQGYTKFCKYFLMTKECKRILEIKAAVDPLFNASSLIDIVAEGALRDATKEIDVTAELHRLHSESPTEASSSSRQRSSPAVYGFSSNNNSRNKSEEIILDNDKPIKSKSDFTEKNDCKKSGSQDQQVSVSTQTALLSSSPNFRELGINPQSSLKSLHSPTLSSNGRPRTLPTSTVTTSSLSSFDELNDVTPMLQQTIKITNGNSPNFDRRGFCLSKQNSTINANNIRSAATLSPPIATRKSQVPVVQKWQDSNQVLEYSSGVDGLSPIQTLTTSTASNSPSTEMFTATTVNGAIKDNVVPLVSIVGRSIATNNTPVSSGIVGTVVRADESNGPVKKLKVRLPKPKSRRGGCRCGNAAAQPGNLTCCGQRCPCYVENVGCYDCRCRGCRNPHLPGGKKLLQGINAVIDTKTNTTVPLGAITGASLVTNTPITSTNVSLVAATSQQPQTVQQIYNGIQPNQFASTIYPLGTVANFAGFSIPLPILSVSHPSSISSLQTGQADLSTIHGLHGLQEVSFQSIKDSILETNQSDL